MKRVALVIKSGVSRAEIASVLKEENFSIVSKNPEFVLSIGGDGTLLVAERLYPSIPKAIVKESRVCKCSHNLPLHALLSFIKQGKYKIKELYKLEAIANATKLVATNDIIVRNKKQINALRFSVAINGKNMCGEVIGDGIVIATPFGSSGYFHSITRKQFDKGFGLAFNNPTIPLGPYLLNENAAVSIRILRTNGLVSADNNPKMITVQEGDIITIKKSKERFRLFSFNEHEKLLHKEEHIEHTNLFS